ncbi:hypothetical protein C8Q74DRAFT_1369824 [Fomes fomentarius]|nr:hypothetical protein C8Q74DRAFT_1369824 [Fomes fomentarius]
MYTILPDVMAPCFLAAGTTQHDSMTTYVVKMAVYLFWFTSLIVIISLIARKFSRVPTPASTAAHTPTPIIIYAVGSLSRTECAHYLADKHERRAATVRAHAAQDVSVSPLPLHPPSLSPAPLSPLLGLGLTGMNGRAEPCAPPTWLQDDGECHCVHSLRT